MKEITKTLALNLGDAIESEWPYDSANYGHEGLLVLGLSQVFLTRGYSCWPEVPYAGSQQRLDLLAIDGNHGIAVEAKMLNPRAAEDVAEDADKMIGFKPKGHWEPREKPIDHLLLVGTWEAEIAEWWRMPSDRGPEPDCRDDSGWGNLRHSLERFEVRGTEKSALDPETDKNLWVLWAFAKSPPMQ